MKNEITDDLTITFNELLSLLSNLNQKQLNTVPFEGSWTAAQLGDHVYKSCGAIETLNGKLSKTERPIDAKTKEIAELFLNYDIKMKSPAEIEPETTEIAKG